MDKNTSKFRPGMAQGWLFGAKAKEYQRDIRSCFPSGTYCSASITRPDHLVDWDVERLLRGWASVFNGKRVLLIRPTGVGHEDPYRNRTLFSGAKALIVPDFIKSNRRTFAIKDFVLEKIHEEFRRSRIDI